ARRVRDDTRVGEDGDTEEGVPQLLLDDLRLLEVDLRVERGGQGRPGLVHRLVGVLPVVLRVAGGVDVLARGDLARAGPREEGDLVVTGRQRVGEEVLRADVDDVEADLVTARLDELDLVGAARVGRRVADADVDRGL